MSHQPAKSKQIPCPAPVKQVSPATVSLWSQMPPQARRHLAQQWAKLIQQKATDKGATKRE